MALGSSGSRVVNGHSPTVEPGVSHIVRVSHLRGWNSAPLFPPKMPFNLAHCHPVQALCDCLLLSSYECGSGEGADSGLEASEEH